MMAPFLSLGDVVMSEQWHVNPTTGLIVCRLPNDAYMVGEPGAGITDYAPDEVEHVVMHGGVYNRVNRP